jgi:hypothetical protein
MTADDNNQEHTTQVEVNNNNSNVSQTVETIRPVERISYDVNAVHTYCTESACDVDPVMLCMK